MTQYLIIQVDECEECKGAGLKTNPWWEEYYAWDKKFHDEAGRSHNQDESDIWWMNKGFDVLALPSEETICPSCQGDGKIESRLDLKEALSLERGILHEAIKAHLEKHLNVYLSQDGHDGEKIEVEIYYDGDHIDSDSVRVRE